MRPDKLVRPLPAADLIPLTVARGATMSIGALRRFGPQMAAKMRKITRPQLAAKRNCTYKTTHKMKQFISKIALTNWDKASQKKLSENENHLCKAQKAISRISNIAAQLSHLQKNNSSRLTVFTLARRRQGTTCLPKALFGHLDYFTCAPRSIAEIDRRCADRNAGWRTIMKGVVLWVAGVPLSVIFLLYLFGFM